MRGAGLAPAVMVAAVVVITCPQAVRAAPTWDSVRGVAIVRVRVTVRDIVRLVTVHLVIARAAPDIVRPM